MVKRLWRVLTAFKNEEKAKYLQFVWGRTRLPLKEETDIEQHTVEVDHKKPINSLPIGKTCFFQLVIPPYNSDSEFSKKLLFALKNTATIDGDDIAVSDDIGEVDVQRHSESDQEEAGDSAIEDVPIHHDDYGSE